MIKPVPYIGEPASLPLAVIVSEQQIRMRNGFDEASLSELAASIASVGLIEPIIVRPDPSNGSSDQARYVVIAGERRLIAADMAGLAEIPVIIRDVSPQEARTIQAIENLQRENLTLADTAAGVAELMQEYKTPKNLSKALGKSLSWISKHLNLSKLKGPVRLAMDAGVSEDAELLLALESLRKKDSDAFAKQIEGLETGTTTRASVREALAKAKAPTPEPQEPEESQEQDGTDEGGDDNSGDQVETITLTLTAEELITLRLALGMYPAKGHEANQVIALIKRLNAL